MAKVTVAYADLEETSTAMTTLNDYVKEVHKEITELKTSVEEISAKHDNCFNDVINALDDLEHAFRNYYNEVEFLAEQCKKAADAFKNAETDAEADANKLTEDMKTVIGNLATMLGLDADSGWNVDDITMDDVEVKSTRTDITTPIDKSTAAQRSETWNNVFEDEDANGIYDKINGQTVSESESIIDGDDDKKEEEDANKEDTNSDTNGGNPSYDDDRSSSGGNPVQYRRKEVTKVEEEKQKEEKKKEDPIKETDPKEEEKKEEEPKKEDPKEEEKKEEEPKEETPKEEPKEETPKEETPKETPKEETPKEETKVTYHTGGGYSDEGGYTPAAPANNTEGTLTENLAESENTTEGVPVDEDQEIEIADDIEDNIVTSDEVTKIPVSNDPISTKETKGGSSVIPIAAGLSAAAAAGLGAKAYMDHKKNNSDDDGEEFESEDWNGDESTDIEYEDSKPKEEYLDDDDYVASEEPVTEKYGARNNEELADLQ